MVTKTIPAKFKKTPSSFDSAKSNHYLDKADFSFELPRLIAQARSVYRSIVPYFDQVRSIFPSNGTFLDLGAGPGVLCELLAEAYFPKYKVQAIDLSDKMIEFGKICSPQIEWYTGNVYNLPMESSSVNVIFSSYVLMHLDNIEKALSEISRVLKKDGLVIIVNPNYYAHEKSSEVISLLHRKYADYIKEKKEGDYGLMDHLPNLSLKYGLSLVESENIIATNDYEEASGYKYDFPMLSCGKMYAWTFISTLAKRSMERADLKKLYEECYQDYMHNKVMIHAKNPIHIYKKETETL